MRKKLMTYICDACHTTEPEAVNAFMGDVFRCEPDGWLSTRYMDLCPKCAYAFRMLADGFVIPEEEERTDKNGLEM